MLVIYNPVAGRGRAKKFLPKIKERLLSSKTNFDLFATSAPLDAAKKAEEAVGKYSSVIAIGGDGTVNEVVNGLLKASHKKNTPTLGIVPMGNGDDFAKVLPPEATVGGISFDWEEGINKIIRGKISHFDVASFTTDSPKFAPVGSPHYFLNGISLGFGAQVASRLASAPSFLTGKGAYLYATIKAIIPHEKIYFKIEIDNHPIIQKEMSIATITNGRCIGNCFWVSPKAEADDGHLDIMLGDSVSRYAILSFIPKIMRGEHLNHEKIATHRSTKVKLSSKTPFIADVDGEVSSKIKQLEIKILPQRLGIFV